MRDPVPKIRATNEQPSAGSGVCPNCGHVGAVEWLRAPDRFHGRRKFYQLVHCGACTLFWLHDPPRPETMGSHYGEAYDLTIDSASGDMHGYWDKVIQTLLQYKTGGAILDLGCGSGSFLASLKGPSWKLSGIEMSGAAAKIAQERTDGQIFSGEILSAGFPPRSFDVITCLQVLEHMYQPRAVLMKVAEWLKPNGIFYVRVPNIEAGEARIFRSYWYALELPRHLFHFSPTSLNHLASSVGLQAISLSTLRAPFIERSMHYIWDEVLRKLGVECQPPATAHAPSLQWKVIRKILRLTILPMFSQLELLVGDGEVIEGVFKNREGYISADGRSQR